MLRFAPFASSAPDKAVQFVDHVTLWFAAQLSTQVGVPDCPTVPSVQVKVLLPVVGCVLSVRLPDAPCASVKADGVVHVLPETVHVVPLAIVQPFAARVVTLQLSVTPPTFTVAVMAVLKDAELVRRTASVWPLVIVPLVTQLPPLMLMVAPVPVTETGVVVLMPEIVIVFDVVSIDSSTFV